MLIHWGWVNHTIDPWDRLVRETGPMTSPSIPFKSNILNSLGMLVDLVVLRGPLSLQTTPGNHIKRWGEFQFKLKFIAVCKSVLSGIRLLYRSKHYDDVIMTTIASQITSLTSVYSTVYSDADQRKHQSSASLAFVWGIHRDRWIPRTKGQLRGKCFHLMTSSCVLGKDGLLIIRHTVRQPSWHPVI